MTKPEPTSAVAVSKAALLADPEFLKEIGTSMAHLFGGGRAADTAQFRRTSGASASPTMFSPPL
ncbi:MAG: hypothetical protein ABTQ27_12765 [Amaricoccus sp.]|uniref:hypothetical protein n=1 Tax=Amaricoccus sp. TaxID=1872485 RepID=UPI0033160D8A